MRMVDSIMFGRKEPPRDQFRMLCLGAIAGLAAMSGSALLFLFYPIDHVLLICVFLFPILLLAALGSSAISVRHSPYAVILSVEGITIDRLSGRRFIKWQSLRAIRIARRKPFLKQYVHELRFEDEENRRIDALPESYLSSGELIEQIELFSQAILGRNIHDELTERLEEKKHLTVQRVLGITSAVVLTLGFGASFIWGAHQHFNDSRLLTKGVRTTAQTLAQASDNYARSYSITYVYFDDDHHKHSRTTGVTKVAWDDLEKNGVITIAYDPLDPDESRVIAGEADTTGWTYLLLTGATSLISFGALVMFIAGYDLRTQRGNWVVTRYGEVVKILSGRQTSTAQR